MPTIVTVGDKPQDKFVLDLGNVASINEFKNPLFAKAIYKADAEVLLNEIVQGNIVDKDGNVQEVSMRLYQWSQYRLLKLQAQLSRHFINCNNHIEMMLACAIAQEPVLFIGPPGVAKTEVAVSFFGGVGLRRPLDNGNAAENDSKYFEYLLSPYTVPEELFGLLNFKELEMGVVTRINTNMITGKRVYGVFLDEVFNASSNILNTLLTLINERRYFDKGMFQTADLKILIGASNDTPIGKYGSGHGMTGKKAAELRAFFDRFTLRLYFPTPQELYPTNGNMIKEFYKKIIDISYERATERLTMERPRDFEQLACVNDILLLGRLIGSVSLEDDIRELTYSMLSGLSMARARDLCTMSPRKANKMFPIIISNSFLLPVEMQGQNISDKELVNYVSNTRPEVRREHLRAFYHVWDYEKDREKLKDEVDVLLES